jgi:rhodanese-related sulfurtransferase
VNAPTQGAVDEVLAACRARITRVRPADARRLQAAGGLLVDIRPIEQRRRFGEVPGALVIDRNVLEWRLDPTGAHRHPEAGPPGRPVVVFCQEGFASSLAADSLRLLGVRAVSDLEGGFGAWAAAGLPVTPIDPVGGSS